MVTRSNTSLPPLLSAPVPVPRLTWVAYEPEPGTTSVQRHARKIKDTICFDMADLLARAYYSHFDEHQLTIERNRLCQVAIEWLDAARPKRNWQDNWKDYLEGMTLAINPLPCDQRWLFYDSDLQALQSDWEHVRADLAAIWSTFSSMHHSIERDSDDKQPDQQDKSADSSDVRRTGRKTAPVGRDHTPSS
jgi:hypothetical protein